MNLSSIKIVGWAMLTDEHYEKYYRPKLDNIFAAPGKLNRNHHLFKLKMQGKEFEHYFNGKNKRLLLLT